MGLSLGVREGARIQFSGSVNAELMVRSVSATVCKIGIASSNPNIAEGEYDIVADERKEILPGVFCQVGKVDDHGGQSYTRLVFEAPRVVQISRL